jgi:hypothetical protein
MRMHFPESFPSGEAIPKSPVDLPSADDPARPSSAQQEAVLHPITQADVESAQMVRLPGGILEDPDLLPPTPGSVRQTGKFVLVVEGVEQTDSTVETPENTPDEGIASGEAEQISPAERESAQLVAELAQTVDWDMAVRAELQAESGAGLTSLWCLMGGERLDQQTPEERLEVAKTWKAGLEEAGYMRDESTLPADDSALERQAEWLPEGDNLTSAIIEWRTLTLSSLEYLGPERKEAMQEELRHLDPIARRAKLTATLLGLNAWSKGQTPPELTAAFKRQIATLFDDFDATDHRTIEASRLQGALQVENAALATTRLGIADPEAWASQKLAELPNGIADGISSVRFTDHYKETLRKKSDGTMESMKTQGQFNATDQKIILGVEPLLGYELLDCYTGSASPEEAHELIREKSRRRVDDTWEHEAAHAAHFHILPLAWLRKWQQIVTKTERVAVSVYEGRAREADVQAARLEGLADAVPMFMIKPVQLLLVGGFDRLRHINAFFKTYDPNVVEQVISQMRGRTFDQDEWKIAEERFANMLHASRATHQA